MSILIEEIKTAMNNPQLDIDELVRLEGRLTEEYNSITEDYRMLFGRIKTDKLKKSQQLIKNCQHNYIRYSEYHNDRYFICGICGHEKY
jgi:hypothetical protein